MNPNIMECDEYKLKLLLAADEQAVEHDPWMQHVEHCSHCQSRLRELAAQADDWQKAAEVLAADDDDVPYLGRDHDAPSSWNESMVKQLLEPPSHPEMLGRLGRYEMERIIGCGGMGIVFKAFDTELNRVVAVKLLAPYLAARGSARKRFAREARAAAGVRDDHVVPIFNVESEHEPPFLVMQYVAGGSLQEKLDRDGPLEVAEVLRIGLQTAKGLAAAHAQGLIHRDVKPSNILLDEGVERALLTDFGLARAEDDACLTRSGFHPGTPHYMSPEQVRGEAIDGRSDLFSLGCVLYALCTGHPPFRAETSYAVMRRITDESPHRIREQNANIPEWLEAIVMKLLSKSREDRFASAKEVAELQEDCLAHVHQPATTPLPVGVQALVAQAQLQASKIPKLNRLKAIHQRIPPIGKFIAAAGGALALFLAGILVVLELDKGTLRIESEIDDVPIRIMQGDEVVKSLTVSKAGATTRIGAGKYIVEIGQEFDKAVIKDGGVELSRGATSIVRVTQTNANTPEDEKAKDQAAKAWLRRPVVGSTHDGKSFQLSGHDALLHCVMTNNSEALNRLLTLDKYDLDYCPLHGQWTLLQHALQHECLETTSLLLQHGANPNFASKGTPLPLELAKRSGRRELVELVQKYLVPTVTQPVQLDAEAKDFLSRLKGEWKLDAMSFDGRNLDKVSNSKIIATLTDHALAKFIGSRPYGPVYEITEMNVHTDPVEISLTRELDGKTGTIESLLSLESGVLTLATPIYPENSRPQSFEPARGVKVEQWTRSSEQSLHEKVELGGKVSVQQTRTASKATNDELPDWVVAWDFRYTLMNQRYAMMRISKDGKMEAIFPEQPLVRSQLTPEELAEIVDLVAKNPQSRTQPLSTIADYSLAVRPRPELFDEIKRVNVRSEIIAAIHHGELLELELKTTDSYIVGNHLWKLVGLAAVGGSKELPRFVKVANRELKRNFPNVSEEITASQFSYGIVDRPSDNITIWFDFNVDPTAKMGQVVLRIPQDGQPTMEKVVFPEQDTPSTKPKEKSETTTQLPNRAIPIIEEPKLDTGQESEQPLSVEGKKSSDDQLIETSPLPKTLDKSTQKMDSRKIYTAEELIANGMDLHYKQQPVTVRFKVVDVQSRDVIDPDGKKTKHWFLSSEEYKDHLDPKAFQVQVSMNAVKALERNGVKDIPAHFNGKELTIVGKVSTSGLRLPGRDTIWFYSITLERLDQLHFVKADSNRSLPKKAISESAAGLVEKIANESKAPAIDHRNARSVVEAYVASALAKNIGNAVSLAKNSPADPKRIRELPEFLNVQRLKIETVYINDPAKPTQALATSVAVKLDEEHKNPDGRRDGFLVFTLEFSDDKWSVIDIDFETETGAEKELNKFLKANPNSIGIPPRSEPE